METQLQAESDVRPVYVRIVPADLWRQLKIRAATDGETLQVTISKAIAFYLQHNG